MLAQYFQPDSSLISIFTFLNAFASTLKFRKVSDSPDSNSFLAVAFSPFTSSISKLFALTTIFEISLELIFAANWSRLKTTAAFFS